jgi:3-methyladenine DNA glycosylase AlkC
MIKQTRDIAEDEQYCTKSLAKNVIKINCVTPETYRKLVTYFKDNNIFFHTYQLKEETAYRIAAIKCIQHSINTEDIRRKISELGHNVRNIINAQDKTTKEPLNLFFVDLETAKNNKEIYNIKSLQNKIIRTEPPRVNTNKIIQCMRCQQYGHLKSYCNKPFICIKCCGSRNCKDCKKIQNKLTPAKCALCGGNHPANYEGCENYYNLIKGNNTFRNNTQRTPPINTNI